MFRSTIYLTVLRRSNLTQVLPFDSAHSVYVSLSRGGVMSPRHEHDDEGPVSIRFNMIEAPLKVV